MTITSFGQALPYLFCILFLSRWLYLLLQIVETKTKISSTAFYAYGIVTQVDGVTSKVQEWTGQRRE